MEKRIELEMRGRAAAEVTELNLDNCRATQLEGLTDELENLETLSLINVGLTSLKGFPALKHLKRLELSDNRIVGGLEVLQGSPNISHLNLSGNKIKDNESLGPLAELKPLKSLDLFNSDVTQAEDYREKSFTMLPQLKFLDGFDKDDREAEDSEEDGLDEDGDEDGAAEDAEDAGGQEAQQQRRLRPSRSHAGSGRAHPASALARLLPPPPHPRLIRRLASLLSAF